jgi:hypothetical protein
MASVLSGFSTASIDIAGDATAGLRTIKVTNPDLGVGTCACFTVT